MNVAGNVVTVKGPKGTLTQDVRPDVLVEVDGKEVRCVPQSDKKETRARWGLYRMLVHNMVVGVSAGFSKTLEIIGVGYRAEMKGSDLSIAVGYSHPVVVKPEEGITLKTEGNNKVVVSGIDRQRVGQVAANIRAIRPPEPYKGKGIRYAGEVIIRKAGKTGAK